MIQTRCHYAVCFHVGASHLKINICTWKTSFPKSHEVFRLDFKAAIGPNPADGISLNYRSRTHFATSSRAVSCVPVTLQQDVTSVTPAAGANSWDGFSFIRRRKLCLFVSFCLFYPDEPRHKRMDRPALSSQRWIWSERSLLRYAILLEPSSSTSS